MCISPPVPSVRGHPSSLYLSKLGGGGSWGGSCRGSGGGLAGGQGGVQPGVRGGVIAKAPQ